MNTSSIANSETELTSPKTIKQFRILRLFLQDRKAVIGMSILGLFLVIALFAPLLATHDPHAYDGLPWQPPGKDHWFGTTDQGQDVYSQWIWGTRTSLFVGLSAGFISTIIAVFIGILGGYKGGWVDVLCNGVTNILLVLPGLPLIIVIAAYVPQTGPVAITLILGLTGWAFGARTKRSQALTFASRDFVVAAKLAGASDLRVLFYEILPNMLSYVVNNFIWAALGAILGEASLEFIGIGNVATVSWGNMLNWAQHGGALLNGGWWWFVPPGASIALTGLSFTLMNFALDEVTNPRLRKAAKSSA